jgi:hypothetical protein
MSVKFFVFVARIEAEEAADSIFAGILKARAQEFGGSLEDWSNGRTPVEITSIPDSELTGERFPLYPKNAATGQWESEIGHTLSWAQPIQITDGRFVIPSYDGTGIDPDPSWWVSGP